MSKLKELGLKEEILRSMDLLGYDELTEVQARALPLILESKDLLVKSQTGSGKTAAFALPICQNIVWEERSPQALVIVPTRELAMQVREEFFNLGRFLRLKVTEIYGKSPYKRQVRELNSRSHIVVGTPGRLLDHVKNGNMDTSKIKYLVLDEADEMLNMGFLEDMEKIMASLPENRVNLLFSATLPKDIEELAAKYMKDPEHIEIESESNTMDRIRQTAYNVEREDKLDLLKDITVVENPDNCIIFCNTRSEVDIVYRHLKKAGYSVGKIHGDIVQDERTATMEGFKEAKFRYLVSTDVAARGIDVDDITHVINYDLPAEEESYIHRIGRTGRKDKLGSAISFFDNYEKKYLRRILNYTDAEIEILERPRKDQVFKAMPDFLEKMDEEQEVAAKDQAINQGILKLHINAGKKTKMRPGDIVGAICSIEGVSGDDIGIISVIDVSSFVEILNNKGEYVLKELQQTEIKGRLRTVSRARR